VGVIVGLEGREMCEADSQNPGASGSMSGGQSKPGADCRMSGTRDGLWRTKEAGG